MDESVTGAARQGGTGQRQMTKVLRLRPFVYVPYLNVIHPRL